jgi:hypothetical protein
VLRGELPQTQVVKESPPAPASSRNVAVREEKGDAGRGQKPFVLVDDKGHVIAERYTSARAWNRAA